MRINKAYYTVDWKKFKKECLEHLPKDYKFKKNELKGMYRGVVGSYKKLRKSTNTE